MGASECAVAVVNTGPDREKQEPGASDEYLSGHDCWSLFRFVGLCCSGGFSSNPSKPSPFSSSLPSTPSASSPSWYHSGRIQRMIEKRGEFGTEVESEIDASTVHWSQLDPSSQTEQSGELNRKNFEQLMLQQQAEGPFGLLKEMDDLVVGEKLAEGGQAEIYEANMWRVVKMFKAGTLLQDLEKQWPPGMVNAFSKTISGPFYETLYSIWGATVLKDERFLDRAAFVMERRWGDLRKLIDQQMIQSNNQGPPFTTKQVILWYMWGIALGMYDLHRVKPPILHRDLKAANVLLKHFGEDSYDVVVADFECSVGVLGTGFWRAPEILQNLKNKVPSNKVEFPEECDVYSYGMTCYEIVTGRIPFEDHPWNDYDIVLNGDRLELPPDLDPMIEGIVTSCWHPDPSQRPSFQDTSNTLWEEVRKWSVII